MITQWKYLGINLIGDVKDLCPENKEALVKEIEGDTSRCLCLEDRDGKIVV
jgi:hypothetical protein